MKPGVVLFTLVTAACGPSPHAKVDASGGDPDGTVVDVPVNVDGTVASGPVHATPA